MTHSAASTSLRELSTALASVTAAAALSVVSVHSHRSRCSGIAWRPGLVITAEQALGEGNQATVTLPGGKRVAAEVAGRDATTNVALLRNAEDVLKPAALEPSAQTAGALALVVGAGDGLPTTALGVIVRAGGPWQSMRGGEIDARIELDARLRPSAEGGLALDADGRAFGMAVFGPRRRVLIIPATTLERVAATLESHGRIPRGYLGIGLQPVRISDEDLPGAMIMNVDPQGPGKSAGLHQGDVIAAWNGEPLRSVPALVRALGPDSIGRTVTLELRRSGARLEVPLTIGERPA